MVGGPEAVGAGGIEDDFGRQRAQDTAFVKEKINPPGGVAFVRVERGGFFGTVGVRCGVGVSEAWVLRDRGGIPSDFGGDALVFRQFGAATFSEQRIPGAFVPCEPGHVLDDADDGHVRPPSHVGHTHRDLLRFSVDGVELPDRDQVAVLEHRLAHGENLRTLGQHAHSLGFQVIRKPLRPAALRALIVALARRTHEDSTRVPA